MVQKKYLRPVSDFLSSTSKKAPTGLNLTVLSVFIIPDGGYISLHSHAVSASSLSFARFFI